jgi:predicted permease
MNADTWLGDLRYALRQLARAPGFTAVAVLTLSIGIGANAAIFSLVNYLLLRPPAHVVAPERIVSLYTSDFSGPPYGSSSYPDYEVFREQRDVVTDVAAFALAPGNLVEAEETVRLMLEEVSPNYFDVLGVVAARGRLLLADADDGAPVVVLAHSLWRSRFGADPSVVGRAIQLNAGTFTVVGVAPEDFDGSMRGLGTGAWVPLHTLASGGVDRRSERGARYLTLLGRLQPGVSVDEARARFDVVAGQLLAAYPEEWQDVTRRGRAITVLPESEARVPPEVRGIVVGFMAVLAAAVALVLLICCMNVANLLLARGSARVREVAIRVSLGASRGRLVRQLMTESVLLACLACGGAIVVTFAAVDLLTQIRLPGNLPFTLDVGVDWRVLGFALVTAACASIVFGLAPAFAATRLDTSATLKEGAPTAGGKLRLGMRGTLITAQVAVSLVLLVSSGLFLRSLQHALTIDPGFDADGVVVAAFDLQSLGYSEARNRAFYAELTERIAQLPEVRGVTLARNVPLAGGGGRNLAVVEGYEPRPGEDMEFHHNFVGPEYFEVMRVPLVRGRGFDAADRAGAPQVAIVNEAFAARFWPGQDPVGKRLTSFSRARSIEVVGVARDGKYLTLTESPLPYVYRPYLQEYEDMTLHVRVAGDLAAMIPTIRREIRAVDSRLPILTLASMESQTAFATLPQRIAAALLGACAVLALLLAAVGLYGVVAYAVSRRTREIGIRMALGAARGAVVRMVLQGSMKLVALGLAIGLALSLLVGRSVALFLGGTSPADPVALLAGPLVLIACAFVASWLPARRAARIDPMKALREE